MTTRTRATISKNRQLNKGVEKVNLDAFLAKKKAEAEKKSGATVFLPKHPNGRPNLDFNDRVTCLNVKRVARLFADDPKSGKILRHFVRVFSIRKYSPAIST